MLEIQYIGSLREDLKLQEEEELLEWHGGLTDVGSLIEHLCEGREPHWSKMLHQEGLLIAVNQSMVKDDCQLSDGDKITFFPKIAGG